MLQGLLPNWVEADPLRERAVDALGLQAVADRLADRLLPGLSVLTTRARYFTFFCWARDRTGVRLDEQAIHRLEVALAIREHELSIGDEAHDCSFVGKRSLAQRPLDRVPKDPRDVYKSPAWRAYRPAAVSLGLLDKRFALTGSGGDAAKAYGKHIRQHVGLREALPPSACLRRVSPEENGLLRKVLGLSLKGPVDPASDDQLRRRALFWKEVNRTWTPSEMCPKSILPFYLERPRAASHGPANTLKAAAVWEHLSLGLNVIFVAWIRAVDEGSHVPFCKALAASLASRRIQAVLGDVPLAENVDLARTLRRAVGSLAFAVRLEGEIPDQCRRLLDGSIFDLGRRILKRRSEKRAVEDTLYDLLQLHCDVKADDAWVLCDADRIDRAVLNREGNSRWQPPTTVRLHPYRMTAFGRIVSDLF